MAINVTDVKTFKFYAHKVMPLVYDESLSYYEFLCKVMAKLNEVINSNNEQNTVLEQFDTEINEWENTTDEKYNEFTEEVNRLFSALEESEIAAREEFERQITGQQEEFEETINGEWEQFFQTYLQTLGVVQVAGTSTTDVMSQKAVTDELNGIKGDLINGNNGVVSSGSVNNLNNNGGYMLFTGVTDLPVTISYASLVVHNCSPRWIAKWLFTESGEIYFGVYDTTTSSMQIDWNKIKTTISQTIGSSSTEVMSQNAIKTYNYDSISSGSVNSLNDNGGYLLLNGVTDLPQTISYASLFVSSSTSRFKFKILMCDDGNIYTGILDTQSSAMIVNWTKINPTTVYETYKGKTIVNFGDSIFGNFQGTSGVYESISHMMSDILGATCINAGFGGCRMASQINSSVPYMEPFCMDNIAEAIRTNTWTTQDAAITEHSDELPDYFPTTLATIKAINWNNVEAVTIAFGTNDWSSNITQSEYTTAAIVSVQRLMQVNAKIKFFLISPIYRWFESDGSFSYDSDSSQAVNNNGNTIPQFVGWCKSTAESLHIPYIDDYYSLGFCQLTITPYFGTDTTHPIAEGRKLMAKHICAIMKATY